MRETRVNCRHRFNFKDFKPFMVSKTSLKLESEELEKVQRNE